MTIAELELWALRRNWGQTRRDSMATFLSEYVAVMADHRLCQIWAMVRDQARRNGRPIEVADAWIAATTISLGVPLLTNNYADYVGVNDLTVVPLLDQTP